MIVVTGASGQLGRAVLERLLERVPAAEIGASVRDPEKVRDLAERGVRVRRGDYTDPASLAEAFEGASQVLVVSANVLGEEALRQHRTAIEAAVAAGARRVLYTSHMGADPTSPMAPMPDHAATEDMLRSSGAAWTSLRNGFYASTVPMLLGAAWHTGELRVPDDGPVAWTTHGDLADVAALALTTDRFDGTTPPLTGPEALTMEDVAALASEAAGRTIRRVVVSDDEYVADLAGHGVPEVAARMLVTMFAASRRGSFAPVDPTLARVLGRPATPLSEVLAAAVPAQA
ncbi:SDR family oxidoreductase [Actinomycetospora flava]|uniref:SDR family oxidoreductase n=1 Tax=Actinomycetospora flava TaxID=3129232 RepID=A0ABU8M661_9PSEU